MSPPSLVDTYALSPMQQGMLFHALYVAQPGVDVEQMVCTFREALDIPTFERAWRRVVAEHAVLRTAFRSEGLDEPVQEVHADVAITFAHHDLQGISAENVDARIKSYLREDRRAGFDMSRPPLMRFALFQVAEAEVRFVWTFHHILLDGRSFSLVMRDVFACYDAFLAGAEPQLEARRPYKDFIGWLGAQDRESSGPFWRELLAGFRVPTPLLGDRPAARHVEDIDYAEQIAYLPAATTAALSAAAKEHKLTLNAFLQGAWGLLFSRYSGETDVVFAATRAGRRTALGGEGTESMLGVFINTLPVRIRVNPDLDLVTWLREVQSQARSLRDHEHTPLVKVREWSELPASAPMFETLLVFEERILDATMKRLGGAFATRDFKIVRQTNFPLMLMVYGGEELVLEIEYDKRRLDDATVARMLGHLQTLLEAMATRPLARVGDLPILTAEERRELVETWNATSFAYPQEAAIHEVFEAQAARTTDAIALVFEGKSLSYRDLNARANQLAHALRKRGVGPDVLVGVCMERSIEMVVALYGILKAGGAYVPFDPEYPKDRLSFMLDDTKVPVVLTQAHLEGVLPPHDAAVIRLDAEWTSIASEPDANPARAGLSLDSLAYAIYTSGSTGRPKGALNAHRGILNRLQWMQRTYGLDASDRVLQKTPFSFDVSVWELFWPLMFGATLVVAKPEGHKDPAYLATLIEQRGITTTHFVPSMLKAFVDDLGPGRCTSLKRVFCSGEALPPAMVDAFFTAVPASELHNLYGPTEAAVDVTYFACRPGLPVIPIGRPVDNTRIYLLDERREPVPQGVRGELYIGGVQVGRGYLNRDELTAERFLPDPFSASPGARLYRTGDVARYLPTGDIEYLGRADFQVKIRGFRIELGEIESVLGRHPGVREATVVVREDVPGDKRIIAYLVLAAERPTTAELRAFLGDRLPEYMVPSVFMPLLAMPLSASGKVDRKALPAPETAAEGRVFVAPRSPVEEAIAAVFAEVLRLPAVSAHDGFFELGGHSLLATRVASRVRAAFGVDLPVRLLFDASTPAALAAYVEGRIGQGTVARPLTRAPRDGVLPLSFAQERMWLLDQLDPGDPSYIIPRALRLRGELDIAALERSIRDIIARHEILRTTFARVDGRAVPVIHASVETSVPVTRWSAVPVAERDALARAEAEAEAHRAFDLATGPLLRVRLLEIDAEDHLLTLMMHHIVSDAWTLEVWNAELAALYQAHREGRPAALPELPIQYLDYAVWQRRDLDGARLDEQLGYWKKRLDGAEKSLDLPTDRPRPAVATRRGAKRRFSLPAELATGLKEISRKCGATLFMTLLAAFDVLLLRYTGQGDLSVGTPVANRGHAETEGLVGFFLNTLVLRTEIEEDLLFSALVQRVKEACLGAYAHQDIPFERLVQELSPERDLGRTPLFQVMFTLQSPTREAMTLLGLDVSRDDVESGTSKFDLTLWMQDNPSDLSCWIEYATDLFDAATIARMEGHLRALLGALVKAPDSRVRDLSILDETERRTVLVDWNATAFAYPDDATIYEIFEAQAASTPDAIALVFEGQTLSYRGLNDRANQVAHALRKRAVGPDMLVGVCMERSIEMVVALYGILKAGGAYVPLDPEYPKDRLAFMLEDTKVRVVLTQAHLDDVLPEHGAEVIRLDSEWATLAAEQDSNPTRAGLSLDSLAYAIYTSGSTGRPKGALNAHRGILNRLQWMQRSYRLDASDRVLQKTPFSFDVSVWEFFWPLMFGATLVVAKPEGHKDPAYLEGLIDAQGITTTHFVPSMLKAFLDELPQGRCASLKRVFCSGESLPPAMVEAFFAKIAGAELHNLYGPTEAAVDVTYFACQPGAAIVPIGRPVDNTRIYLLDSRMEPVAIGVRGELYIGGVQVGRGYLNRPELTAERFLTDPFSTVPGARLYRTGDVARHLPSGEIEYLGRADFQVKIRGFRIELGEIEAALGAHPVVGEVTVLAREDAPGQKRLVGYLVCAAGQAPTVGDLRAFLKDRLPEYMVPSAFVLLDEMPLTSSGKVNRRALPAPEDGARAETGAEFVAPRTSAEEALSRIWAGILRLPRVGIHDNFFELGGDSILSIQVVARALQAGLHLTPRQLFQHQTVAELAAVAGSKSTVTAEQGPVVGAAPLTPVQRWWRELAPADPQHWNQSFFLEAGESLDPGALEKAVSAIVDHHDALRLRLVGEEQVFALPGDPAKILRINLSSVPSAEQAGVLEKTAAEVQGSLDLEHGPVIRVALFTLGVGLPERLLVVIHHLAIDGVSWRILLEDLWMAYSQAARKQAISLPKKTTSAKRWAELLVGRARSPEMAPEEAYWTGRASLPAARLPVDHSEGGNTEGSARSITVTLTEEETEALLRKVPEAYQTQINDVLLTAFSQVMEAWTGSGSALFDLEGHGREDLFEGVDLTRTVGWFTTVYPVLLEVDPGAGPGEALKSVKEQLRAVPENGLGHGLVRYLGEDGNAAAILRAAPQAEVSFNYLGQRDRILPEGAPLKMARESAGPAASPRAQRRYLLDVLGRVTGGVLTVRWIYSENRHTPATIEALASNFVVALRALVAHCLSPEAGGYTPSDFRRARLAQPVIDRLVAAEGGKKALEDAYPLSPIQAGILFHTLYDASPEAYVVQLAWTLRGALDVPTFTRAWRAVVDRHPILRTAFEQDRLEEPLQIVKRRVPVAIAQMDISALSPADQAERIERYSTEDRRKGFNPTQAPLMRWSLLRLADGAHRFIWNSHHLLLDGWSTQLVVKEVFALYDAFLAGDEPRLERVVPYGEYIGWIRRQSQAPAEAFWRERLQGFSAPTPLGVDRPLGPGAGERYGELRFEISESDSGLLAAFARKHKLTVSTLVQGAWAILLSRYSREDDVVFGSTVSGRSAAVPGIDRMVGLFINTLPVRAKIAPEQTTLAWLSRLQEEQSVLREHEHSPLVDVQGYSAVPRGTPLFESLVVFENYPVEESAKRGARGFSVTEPRFIERPPYPLTVIAVFRSTLFFRIGFDLARFDEATIARLTGHLHTLLLGMAAAPESPVAALPILPAAERHTLITELNATAFAYPEDACIHELFEAQAARTPEAPALVFGGKTLSYGELNGRANRLAHALRKRGVGPDVLVGVCMERSVEMVVALYGILKAGGAYVPFDPEYPKDRLSFMLEDTRVPVVLTQHHLEGVLPEHTAEEIRLDAEWMAIASEPESNPGRAGLSLDTLAYAIFTSGSTGRPKGALNAHRGILNRLQWMQRAYPLGAGDRVLQKTPFSFDVSVWEFFWPLMFGATLVVAKPDGHKDPAYLAALIEEQKITTTHFVPSMLKAFVDDLVAARCPSLTRVFCSGEALPASLVDAFFTRIAGAELHNLYGPTEAAVDVTYFACRPGAAIVPIGRPVDNTRIYLLDDRMEPVPTGVRGELYIGGVQVGRGYLNRPELTAERFVADPFSAAPGARLYRTGDVARYLSTGDIEYLGRADFQVKIRGFRIELGEIETALAEHAGVREAAVLAREDVPGDKRLVAYLVLRGAEAPSVGELRTFLEGRLPAYMVPSAFVTLEAFPLSAAGKLDRRALPAPEGHGLLERVYVAPRGPVEESLAGIFAEVLHLDAGSVGAHDVFFDLGGHSLLATQAMSRLRAAFGVELPLRSIFDAPTPAALARLVENALGAGQKAAIPMLVRAGEERATALSFAQERLWFLSQLDASDPAYLVLLGMRLEGRLDRGALGRALAEIMRRHEVLRTTFASVDGKPHAVIHEDFTLELPETNLRSLAAGDRDEAVRQASIEEARQPFDLGTGPLIRARLLAFGDDDHALFLSMHHVVADDWTLAVLTRELGALYATFHAGEASPLADLAVQYADYALWQRRWLEGAALDEQLDYWTRHLDGAPRILELPTDRPRPPVRSSRGARKRFELGRELSDKLTELSRREGATLFMTLHAAFDALLHRYTGQADIVVGSPIANRTRAETEALLGLFINTLVLRVEVAPELSFKDLIARVREVCLGAYAHQDTPFERLVQRLDTERDPSRSPLFQVIFNLQNAPGGALELPDLRLSPIAVENPTVKTDLVLIMNEGPQGLRGSFYYSTELFEAATIERLVTHFVTLLEGAVKAPTTRIGDLPLLPEAELRRVVSTWNDTRARYATDATIHGLFEERVDRTPDALALVAGAARLSFRELDRRANQIANHLRKIGVGLDSVVGLSSDRSAGMIEGLLGILKAGGAYVPLDPAYPAPRLAQILEEAGAAVVVTEDRFAANLPEGITRVRLDTEAAVIAGESDARPVSGARAENLVYVLFTSGSTGKPKGVAIEHRQLVNYVFGVVERLDLPVGSSYAHVSTFSADLGNTVLFPPLCLGGTLHVIAQETTTDPDALGAYFAREEIDCLKIVPSHLSALLSGAHPERVIPRKLLVLGGEGSSWELVARIEKLAPATRILNHYGPTETTVGVLTYAVEKGQSVPGTAIVPLGRPLPNSRVYVLDAQQKPAPIGVPGEAYIGGSGVARGYLGRPDLTAERFVRDPFAGEPGARMYRTGDRVRRLADGTLVFLGRIDFQVKIRGFRIELGEIEASLASHPDVKDVVVLALEDASGASGNTHLAAFVVARSTSALDPAQLASFVAARLPEYMVPASIAVLPALPLTSNGKIDRAALTALDRPEAPVVAVASMPRNPTEEVLASIWEDVFGKEQIGIDESFADLGGHSLLAIQIIARARDAFQAEISLRAIFERPTIRGLAAVIEESVREGFGLLVPAIVPVPRAAGMELSFSQERLWFLDQLEPESSFYNVPVGWSLQGRLDTGALERAVREVVRRHEVLRTTFTTLDGRPSQVIHTDISIRLPVSDISALPAEEREEAAKKEALAEANRPFDLARGPLLRVKLLRLSPEDHVLLLTLHHIVSDAWTRGILNAEIGALYEAFREARPSPLAELPIQYADYAHWQRRWLDGEVLDKQLEYWRTALDGAPRVLELPADRPRPPVSTHRGAHLPFTLPPELSTALVALSRREGTTLFMTLLSAFSVLLHRYTGQTDILIGTPVANRAKAELESLIGFFINTLVLRAQMSDDLPFVELMARVREACIGGYAHQDMPFESLVQQLSPDRDLGRTPLFQVLFQLQAAPIEAMALPGLTLRAAYPEVSTSKFDLTLSLMQGPAGLRGIFEYSTDLFEKATIERMVGHLQTLLQGIVASPENRLFELPLLTASEHADLLRGFQSGAREFPVTSTVHERFEAQVDRTPDALAVTFEGESLSYRELDARSSRLAQHLRKLGVGREVLTGICVQRSLSMVIAILGVLKAGGAYLPLDPEYPKDRLAFMVEDSKVPVIVTESAYVATLPEHAARVVCLDTDADAIAQEPSSRLEGAAPADLAYVIYTSGSTGKPKGAMVTHENVVRLFDATDAWYHFNESDVWTLFHSYAFDFSVWELWGALLYGGRVVVVPYWISRAPDAFYKLLGDEGVTVLNQTPSAFRQLVFAEQEAGIEAQKRLQLRYVVFGGEALDLADLKPFWDRHGDRKPQLVNMYGITETTVHVTYRPVSLADLERPWSSVIGCPIPDLDVYIVDGRRNLVPIGVPGEMLVGGAGVSRGYLRRPELTAERFFPDTLGTRPGARLYKTGDLARYLPNGDVEYLGRIDHQVKIRGFRIELGEIEAVLEQHAAVREAIVLAREDGPGEKRLVGYLVCAEGQGPTVGELRAFLKEKLPEYMVPAAFVLLDKLPLTSNGKVDRKALPAPEAGERLTLGESFVAPRSSVEEALTQVWASALRVPRVGIHDNFFELGGDSILSIQIVSRALAAGVKITPRQLFQHQSIAELAEVAGTAGATTAEQGPVTGIVPLTPIAHWWLEQKVASPSHYNQAYFLEVREALDAEAMTAALGCLIEHHDALRVRLDQGEQRFAALGEVTPFQRIALQGVPEEAQKRAMEQTAADVQASLDLGRGPALRAVLFDLGGARSNRLLIVIHHLACDGVSWRILFEDLWTAYEQRRRGEAMSLPAKTTSFKQWAERLTEHARSEALTDEAAYWSTAARSEVWRLPVDHDHGENTEESLRAVSLSLTEEETDALLRKVPEAYRTQINDVLLSAVALALTRWTGAESALVDLEGHGREEIFDDVDLTRTVGWFTTVFPVLLDVPGRDGPGEVLTSVKEQLRAVPGRGLGYGLLRYLRGEGDAVSAALVALPQAEVSFNYLGQLDQAFPESSPFRMAPESVGPSHSVKAKRRYRLDVRSSVLHGKLGIRWAYSENQYRAETIAALSARVMEALRELIAHCLNPEAGGYTPSDFDKANLSREDLNDVMDSLDLDDDI
jgi:amino acid adenylation domain-containing protein/non-ribosomal peptide synthase protein (TIGR01720 family)